MTGVAWARTTVESSAQAPLPSALPASFGLPITEFSASGQAQQEHLTTWSSERKNLRYRR